MNFNRLRHNTRLKKWTLRFLLIAPAFIIIIFNDRFGDSDNEGYILFSFFYFLLLVFLLLRWIFKQIKLIIRLKNEKAKTELQHLKSQVNPHFFFNTLNNLYGLVGTDTKKAQDLILKLSDMMRYSIYEGERDFVTLKGEVDYLNNYLELHKMRYHKEIDIAFYTNIHNEDTKVMPLLFIMLLENAFKHGVENLRKDAYVSINLTSTEKEIYFEVVNNFDVSIQDKEDSKGIGLNNLKRRLELAYPNKHSLILGENENVYKAELVLQKL